MRSTQTRETYSDIRWDFSQPDEDPDSVNEYSHEYSQDLVISQNNGFRRDRRNSKGAVGGDFLVYRRYYEESSTLGHGPIPFSYDPSGLPARPYYLTPQFAITPNVRNHSFPLPLPSDRSWLNSKASEAISQIAPNKPAFSLASFLGELREGLPSAALIGRTGRERASRTLGAGDEYLNVEFGWKPLLSDIRKFSHAVKNADRILDEFENGAGKLVRRNHKFPTKLEITDPRVVHPNITMVPTINGFHYGSVGTGVLTEQITTRHELWFTAAFMYGIPPRGTPQGYSARANKLLGTNLSPQMLWELAPWSWALDWAGNVGTLAENLTLFNSDCLVMPWNYIMEQKTTEVLYEWRSHGADVYRQYPGRHHSSQKFTTVMKYRQHGTPFGFNIDWPEFSARQLAILASLGISKAG